MSQIPMKGSVSVFLRSSRHPPPAQGHDCWGKGPRVEAPGCFPLREGRDAPEPILGKVTQCVGSKIHPVHQRRLNGSTLAIESPEWDATWEWK